MVYVLNQNGQPLMPTENHAKVRVLLKQGKAKVVNKEASGYFVGKIPACGYN